MTLPLFFPFPGSLCGEKNAAGLCTPPRWLFRLLVVAVFSALSVLLVSRMVHPATKTLQTSRLTTFARRINVLPVCLPFRLSRRIWKGGMAYRYRGRGSQPESAGESHG